MSSPSVGSGPLMLRLSVINSELGMDVNSAGRSVAPGSDIVISVGPSMLVKCMTHPGSFEQGSWVA